ncbi:MAG: sigma-70 family RNA polymerase sigma factor [Cetobacterium sp.]|uniref:RNA polymerase sporulation-specific sigma factor n=1 Tax=Cetobacterium ceti TaxID=180163 RepID=A0A1T4R6B2_9FUSO|nr:sigma-70 family RNA polymerase sigma factor [Cetobacterium ceti]MCJ8343732.1 sigma-70 family RNA polymerase sigma factor [Cetobacterium sp.]SKA11622.1 RNA polymerase sporulation-specific sigma factor [Cetobacterium ceti]
MITNTLIKEAQNGNEEALNEIFEECKSLITLKNRKYFIIGGDKDDLFQEGMIGLIKAIRAYDETKSSFKTFALLCIKRQILTAINTDNAGKNRFLNQSINDFYITEEDDFSYDNRSLSFYNPEELFLAKEKLNLLENYLEGLLSKMEMAVFRKMEQGYSYVEIAEILGITSKASDNCIQRIKKKINKFIEKYELN